jgi:hypothetical protein
MTLTSRGFIKIAAPVAALLTLLTIILPSDAGARYAQIAHASAVSGGGLFALWVVSFYRASMRTMPFPIPRDPAVTMTVLPVISNSAGSKT